MFTGLVQCKGIVQRITTRGTGLRLTIQAPGLASEEEPLVMGESIAVSGACLTVAGLPNAETFEADVLEETLRCTMFRTLSTGDAVNLERALRFGDRLGGHIVSGHVDEVGVLLSMRNEGKDRAYRFGCSERFALGVIRKGSVTISGTSLTVSAVGGDWFEVSLIPTTLRETTLGTLPLGGKVNLEADLIGAYVRRALGQTETSLTQLIAAGFAD